MYLSSDEARSDVILAGAATVFGGILVSVALSAPGVPTTGVPGRLVATVAWFVLSGLTPLLLARYRDDVPGAFGVRQGAHGLAGPALALAAPVGVLGVVRGLLVDGSPLVAVMGRPGRALLGSASAASVAVEVIAVLVLTIGSLMLVGFLVVRGRDAFRSDDRASTQLLRTIGAGAAATALLLGGLRALTSTASSLDLLLNVVALVGVLLVADRLVPPGAVVSRPAVLAPVVVVVLAHVLSAGGIFRGDLLLGLSGGAFAAGTTLAIAVVSEHRGTTTVALPLLVAVYWWPTCLGPLPFAAC
jgi:hypothetical protein